MNNEYTIYFKEATNRVGVYLVPHGVEMEKKSLFKIRIGFIDLDENPLAFHCIDSSRMTLEVMGSIVYQWREWELTQEKSPI